VSAPVLGSDEHSCDIDLADYKFLTAIPCIDDATSAARKAKGLLLGPLKGR
jgi:hypothetical protein